MGLVEFCSPIYILYASLMTSGTSWLMSPVLWKALNRWAAQEFRSVNGQIEFLLQRAVDERRKRPRRGKGGGEREA